MVYLIFEDRTKKASRTIDPEVVQKAYPDWKLDENPEDLLLKVESELKRVKDKNILLHLKRMKIFLDDGISKGHTLVLD